MTNISKHRINRLGFINKYMHDVIIEIDQNCKYIYISPSHKIRLGRDMNDLKDKSLLEFIHPEDKCQVATKFRNIINNNTEEIAEYRYCHPVKGWIWLESIASKYKNCDGAYNVLIDSREITDRKNYERKLEKSEERYKSLFENMTEGFAIHEIIFDEDENPVDYRYLNINPAFERLMGLGRGSVIGRTINEMENGNPDFWSSVFKPVIINGNGQVFEKYFDEYDKYFNLQVYSPKKGLIAVIFSDISEKKRVELLEKEVIVSKESAEFKQKFLANMSHEIRTPLTGVIGFIQMLSRTELDADQKLYVDALKTASENLKTTINLILDYSKIEAGKVTLTNTVIKTDEIFNNVEGYFNSVAHKDLTFIKNIDNNLPTYIKIDAGKLNQVLNNLVSNAVKFTTLGYIKLTAKSDPIKYKDNFITIHIEVIDTGGGINDQAKQYLFQPFSQIDNKLSTNIEGTGLGLSICKELVTMLGGEIHIKDNIVDGGSIFYFDVQAGIPTESEIHGYINESNIKCTGEYSLPKLKILLVDDKYTNQLVISLLLKDLGHQIIVANNGQDAIEKLNQNNNYDIILMDIEMPVMNGIEATKYIKQNFISTAPIIGLSANALEGDRERYISQGMDEYLTKPIDLKEFNKIIQKHININ